MRQGLAVRSLVDALVAAVRAEIVGGVIPSGALLTELGLARSYDVARPTAKAALERLVYEGLLQRDMNRTARVPTLGADDIRDMYKCREVIEGQVVAALAGRGEVPAEVLRARTELRATSVADVPMSKIVECDLAFHRALVDAMGSVRLSRCYLAVVVEAHLCIMQAQGGRGPADPVVAEAEHGAILDAIGEHDAAEARRCLRVHLDSACRRLIGAGLEADEGGGSGGERPTS